MGLGTDAAGERNVRLNFRWQRSCECKAQQLLKAKVAHEIFFYSITVKPEEDTPDKLRAYADMHGIRDHWQFLTGAPEDVERLRRTLGYVDLNPKVDQDKASHSGVVALETSRCRSGGRVSGQRHAVLDRRRDLVRRARPPGVRPVAEIPSEMRLSAKTCVKDVELGVPNLT